jgi:uncharacterized membrane protein HdeD (DUF308 family)
MTKKNMKEMMKRSWSWMLGLGILFVVLGSVGLSMVVGITLASMFFLGVLLVIAGVSQIIDVIKSKHWDGAFLHTLIAVLYLAGGGLIIYDPLLASSLITAALAGVLVVIGVARIWMAMLLGAREGWGWFFISGLSALMLGIIILLQWPISGMWFIGLMMSIELIISGWTYIFLAISIRRL